MKKPISISLMALLFPVVALSNEPSAFSAGDINSPNPYGLTSSEKKILQSNQKVSEVKAELGSVTEQLEGMRSVLDGYNAKIAKMDERMRKLEEYVEENRQIQEENQEKVKAVLSELGSLIDSINKNYVPKAQFDKLAAELKSKASSSKADEKVKAPTPKELAAKDSATLMKEADDFFVKSTYTEAKVRYDELLKRNYKPAKINFTLGEIAYNQKSYSTAIEYYKSSIALFDKAAYTPTLLFHTGASFDKLGKKKEAQNFYKALKEGYPDSPEAKKVK
jgi:TolA-binding protein